MSRLRPIRITALAYRQWRLSITAPGELFASAFEPFLYLVIFASIMGAIVPEVIYEGVSYSYLTFMLPGMLAMAAFQRGVHAGTPIYVDRLTGETETMFGLPVSRIGYLLSIVSAAMIQGLLYSVVLVAVGKALSPDLPWDFQRVLLMIAVAGLLTITSAFVFACVSCIVRRQGTFNVLINVTVLPLTLMSSAFYPLDHAPVWIRLIAAVNPVDLAVDLMRHTLLAPQFRLSDLVAGIWPLVAFGLAAGVLASYLFNHTLK